MKLKKFFTLVVLVSLLLVVFPVIAGLVIAYGEWSGQSDRRYRCNGSTFQSSASVNEAAVEIYAARSARWRGVVSVHTWLTIKKKGQVQYERYEVIGWYRQESQSHIRHSLGKPDHYWYGYKPEKLFELKGPMAEAVIPRIEEAIKHYPYANTYQAWPGPNSNTFVAYISRKIPELQPDMPPTAIGKDYFEGIDIVDPPSNSGFQLGIEGIIGITLALEEGIELNIGGAVYGFDFSPVALKVIAVGRIDLEKPKSDLVYNENC